MSSNRTAFYGDGMLFNDQGHTARTGGPADHILLEMTPKRPACFEWILVENGSCHGCNAAGVEQAPESKAAPVELLSCESPWVLGALWGSPWVLKLLGSTIWRSMELQWHTAYPKHPQTTNLSAMFDPTLGRGDP